jgi:hypothetical protein
VKTVFYTASYGNRDNYLAPHPNIPNVDWIVFTDTVENKNLTNWEYEIEIPEEILCNEKSDKELSVRRSRYIKLHPHFFFENYDYTIWIDSNVGLKNSFNLDELISELNGNEIALFKHPMSESIFDELCLILKYQKEENPQIRFIQILNYIKEGFDCSTNLIPATTAVITKLSKNIENFYNTWWNEIVNNSYRDQLSFNYSAYKTNTKFSFIKGDIWEKVGFFFKEYNWVGNQYFCMVPHTGE